MNKNRRFYVIVAAFALFDASACSRPVGPVCYPVAGKVTFRGQPVAEAMVVLHRVGGDVEGHQKPMAYTTADGTFQLTTIKHSDGAPVGDYVITVELRAPKTVGEEAVRSGPNLLPAQYAKPESSHLKYSVVAGDNQNPTIELK
jgi:hypothetical protein